MNNTIAKATRDLGLEKLNEFIPSAGELYARDRNYDHGSQKRKNVSVLSPYIRHRLISEAEVVSEVLQHHSLPMAEKFIQEVFWRSYWKGWLEMRPSVWQHYCAERDLHHASLERGGGFTKAYKTAIMGNTGIECFDIWVKELIETGYLHNHTRMWFASVWIFTLNLPWALGADFFYQHLLDGDPASNTLSWRWVAGLHTKGKTYLATRDNIARYTDGRFSPKGLASVATPVQESFQPVLTSLPVVPLAKGHKLTHPCGLLLCEEDLSFETQYADNPNIKAVAAVSFATDRTPQTTSHTVITFTDAALADALSRSKTHFVHASIQDNIWVRAKPNDVRDWLALHNLKHLIIPFAPVGPAQDAIIELQRELPKYGISVERIMRSWDKNSWPHCSKGFFALKEKISTILQAQGIEH